MNQYLRLPFACFCLLTILSANTLAKSSKVRVVWQADPAHQATIGWDQMSGTEAKVVYGIKNGNDSKLDQSASVARVEDYMGMNNQYVHLKDLKPDTAYAFVVRDSEGDSEQYWFRTAPDKPKPFTFIAGGDTKTSNEEVRNRYRRSNRFVAKLRPLFVVFAGDITSDGFDAKEWQRWLDDWTVDTTTSDNRLIPIVPVRGNHEPDEEICDKLFGLFDAKNYFAFNVGGDLMRVYVLNSEINIGKNIKDIAREDITPALLEQTAWLKADLEANPQAKFKITSFHKPFRPHTRKKAENDYLYDLWAQLFYDHAMSLAIEGDSHMHKITYPVKPSKGPGSTEGYIRDDQRGTIFIGEGSWGAGTREADDSKPWTLQASEITQFKWIQVYPDHFEIRTVHTDDPTGVGENSEDNVFAIPKNIKFYKPKGGSDVVRFPFTKANNAKKALPTKPTHAEVAYGSHKLQAIDFWQAEGEGPRPLLVYIHGGGWVGGDKKVKPSAYQPFLEKGISYASVNYRLTGEVPLPAPVHDAARALQFIRSKADEWNIDKNRIALTGGSAGACTSMWLLLHDDLADPNSSDPVARESTRVSAAAVRGGQTSIDPKVIEPWLGPNVLKHRMINMAVGEATIEGALKNYDKHRELYLEFSPYNHLDGNDPPLLMTYGNDMTLPSKNAGHGIHHPVYGVKMKEKADDAGHECHLLIQGISQSKKYADANAFLMDKLLAQ